MSVTTTNLVLGPARLYVGVLGAAEPEDSAVTPNGPSTPPASPPWTDVGGTDGGVTAEIDSSFTDLQVDQIPMLVGSRLTDLKITVATKMSELTLANLNFALNGIGLTGGGSGFSTFDVPATPQITQSQYAALIIDGWAPYTSSNAPALRRVIVRKVLAQSKVTFAYDKKTQQFFDVTWTAYYVSSSINPIHIVDQIA